jgi:acetoin utilization protein AcuC
VLALGGGGYDLENVARAWTHAWALLNDVELPAELPPAFLEHAAWFRFRSRSLWDPPAAPDRERCLHAREYADRQLDQIRHQIFPLHGL